MRKSHILHKLTRDEPSWCITLHLTDPSVYELASLAGIDGIWMDLEHHSYSVETAGNLMRAARVGDADIVARPGKGELMRMGRLLELGATGIMYPRCDGPEEAAEVVRWAKFAPLGERGFDGANPDMPYCSLPVDQYVQAANEQTFIIAQLEQIAAVEQAEAIAAVEGISFIMLGPADFSVLSGIPGQFDHPQIQQALDRISTAARNTGKQWAATASSVEQSRQLVAAGCRLIFHQADVLLIKHGIDSIRDELCQAGFRFRKSPK